MSWRGCSWRRVPPAPFQPRAAAGALPARRVLAAVPRGRAFPPRSGVHFICPQCSLGGACPTSSGRLYTNSLFGGIELGSGPVLPLLGVARARDVGPAKQGVLRFIPSTDYPGWFSLKTLWFSFPSYQGPVFIRGRQLDGSHSVGIGDGPSTNDPEFPAGPTVNGGGGFREWPGATWLSAPGCYAWQVDGLDFSSVIVFTAEIER